MIIKCVIKSGIKVTVKPSLTTVPSEAVAKGDGHIGAAAMTGASALGGGEGNRAGVGATTGWCRDRICREGGVEG